MISLLNGDAFQSVSKLGLDAKNAALLTDRINDLGTDLVEWTEYFLIEEGDTEEDMVRAAGFNPLIEPINGVRFGDAGFHKHWDRLTVSSGWFEVSMTFGSVFVCVLLVADSDRILPDLIALCREYGRN